MKPDPYFGLVFAGLVGHNNFHVSNKSTAMNKLNGTKCSTKVSILVLIYGKNPEESTTLKNLSQIIPKILNSNIELLVWNNGPKSFEIKKSSLANLLINHGVNLKYKETLSNTPISLVYNNFLISSPAKWSIIFDDDSEPDLKYLQQFFDENILSQADIITPRIISHGQVVGPKYKNAIIKKDVIIDLQNGERVFFIGSGFAISSSIVNEICNHYGCVFDERYALYGVDTTIGLRLEQVAKNYKIRWAVQGSIKHSLSRMERSDAVSAANRRKERGIDFGLTIRLYPRLEWVGVFMRILYNRIFRRDALIGATPSVRWIFAGIIMPAHPRCAKFNNPSAKDTLHKSPNDA